MADHIEIRPDDASLPLTLADIALRNSNMRLTYLSGTIAVDNGDGTETWIGGGDSGVAMPGSNGIIPWVGDTTPPGVPTGVTAVCRTECVFVQWDGTLEGGIPADFDHVELYAKPDGGETMDLGQLRGKGELATGVLPVGDVVEVWGVAYDNAHDANGVSKPNVSDESEHVTVIIAPIVSQKDLADSAEEILAAAKSDAAKQVEAVNDGLVAANKRIDKNTDAATALKKQQEQLSSDLCEAGKRIGANEQGVDAVRKQQDVADASLRSMGQTITANKTAQDAINAQQAEANRIIEQNKSQLSQAQKDIQVNKTSLDTASKSLAQAQADLSQARKDIAQTKSDLTTANGEISKAKESAAQAYAEAHSKNHTFRGPDEPDASKGLIVGDLWLKTQKYWTRWQGEKNNSPSMLADFYTYWTGAPNASPSVLVPLADRVIDTLVWDGSKWNHMGYADVENNAKQIEQAKSDIADNAAKTTDAKNTAENAAAAAKNAQGTADTANGAAKTAQDTANAATAAAKSATATAGQAKDAANAAQTAAENAKKTAGNAQTLANTANESANAAKSTAVNASSVATQAKATADSAAQSATDAANAAQKANTAAAAAAGVANGKADVLIQSTAPDTSMRKPTTLWIDTTNGANTPKRWNGSGWMAVTDKAATDAANAAVKAHAAAQTAQSTADKAQITAANAASQANQAQAAAKKAQTTADGKNLIYRGPDEPSHDGLKPGDMWWRTQKYWTRWQGEKNNSPSMLADFYTYWQGAPNASPSVLVPLTDRVIEVLTWDGTRFTPFDLVANNILAAGTVAAKHLAVDSVTAEKVKANAITVDKLAVNSVTTENLVSDAVTAAKLAADSVQARNIVSLAITTDKLAANSVTTAKLRVTEDMTVALLNAHKIQAGEIAANAVTAVAIAAGAVNADKIAVNSVTGTKISADALYGKTIQGGVFQTSDKRLIINDSGIVGKAGTSRKQQAYYTYWQGEPNNSPSVLVTVDLDADETFAYSTTTGDVTIRGQLVSGSSISGTTIIGSEFRTSNSHMLLNDSGLKLTDKSGAATVVLDAASGDATFKGKVNGSSITGGTITGATITGSEFTSPDGKTKLNSSGFYVGDKLSYDASTGALWLKGDIQSGSTIGAVTMTGATIQTSAAANRGLKMTSGGLVAYDGSGNAKFTLKSDGSILMNGALMTNGRITTPVLEGGTITGGTITGTKIQSSVDDNTGFKLTGGALDFYDGQGNQTVHLNGSSNLLTGSFSTAFSGPRLELRNTTDDSGAMYGLIKCFDSYGTAWYVQGESRGEWSSSQPDPLAYRRLNVGVDAKNSELSIVRYASGASRVFMQAGRLDLNSGNGWTNQLGVQGIYMNGSRIDPVVYTDLTDWFVPASGWTSYAGSSGKDPRSHMTVIGSTCYMQLELQRADGQNVTFQSNSYRDIGYFKPAFIPRIGLNVPCVFNNGLYGGAFVPGNPSDGDGLRGHLYAGVRQTNDARWVSVFMMFTI